MNSPATQPPDRNLQAARQFWLIQLRMAEANLELLDQIENQQKAAEGMAQIIQEQKEQLELYRADAARRWQEQNKDIDAAALPETKKAPEILNPSLPLANYVFQRGIIIDFGGA